jgi:hypothetical protein
MDFTVYSSMSICSFTYHKARNSEVPKMLGHLGRTATLFLQVKEYYFASTIQLQKLSNLALPETLIG